MINLSIAMLLLSFNIPQCLSIAPLTYSQADSKTRYANLVTYIVDYPWCLSAGYAANGDSHNLKANEHNLYWCHNYQDDNYNQHCNCLGLFHEQDGTISYKVNDIIYKLQRDEDKSAGNEVHGNEYNLKAGPESKGNADDFGWDDRTLCHYWNGALGCSKHCCIEWTQHAEMYVDLIDKVSRYGREAKCDGNDGFTGCGGSAGGDDVYWKESGGTETSTTTKPPIPTIPWNPFPF
eukprot:CAMPEP_0201569718 /NCGR_PEP_ID=MMETSP0190_2-20130828/11559_1 /ASSEMBLY_ACC=CAM_ASM_000263 /TAXON_ID=37353 /ORGANISM="Rosalina sp." /LENGTH=234 /DNA_ID=CAMNT_0047992373 /DNA_START=126 /DNA_END=830 /DNA_ORIENTATION=+